MRYLIGCSCLLLVMLLVACNTTQSDTEVPTRLPTAVPPDTTSLGSWAVSFSHTFPDNFWPEGLHRYAFHVECPPELAQINYAGRWQMFDANVDAALYPDPVFLRIQGLSADSFQPLYLPQPAINPAQNTEAIIHFLGLSKDLAFIAGEQCEAFVAWDQHPPQELVPLEPFQP